KRFKIRSAAPSVAAREDNIRKILSNSRVFKLFANPSFIKSFLNYNTDLRKSSVLYFFSSRKCR
ncbi:MAG TPA: hypothetical protein DD733_01480, partial [Clostridiales bacterium]|nr:hypothetical protein [Clostridiales bacterium]